MAGLWDCDSRCPDNEPVLPNKIRTHILFGQNHGLLHHVHMFIGTPASAAHEECGSAIMQC